MKPLDRTGKKLVWAALALAALAGLVVGLPHSQMLFAALFPQLERPVYTQEPFTQLLWQHCQLVGLSSAVSIAIGTLVGVGVTRPSGQSFRPVVDTVVSLGQTFPPVAVLAVAVPVVGFGELPALIALALYGLLPVLQGTVSGLQSVPEAVRQSASGLGMSAWERLRSVEVPLALPVWMSGVRKRWARRSSLALAGSIPLMCCKARCSSLCWRWWLI